VALFGFLALFFNGWLSFEYRAQGDLYFQYYPIRFVFPALLIPLGWAYLTCPTRLRYWVLWVFLSAGVLWNFDSGLPAWLAWLMTLSYRELGAGSWRGAGRRSLGHLAAGTGSVAAALALFSSLIALQYGAFPQYKNFFLYQQLFYGAGYYKSPIGLPRPWLLPALVYLAGLACAAALLAKGRATPRGQIIFLLSVLGLGLSSYFQGNSDPMVLFLVWWPAHLLLALFLDELLPRLREQPHQVLTAFVSTLVAWVLVGSGFSVFTQGKFCRDSLLTRFRRGALRPALPEVAEDAAMLRRHLAPGEKLFVASYRDALIHLVTRINTVYPSSLCQMLLMEDFHRLAQKLEEEPEGKVFIEKPVFELLGWFQDNRGLDFLVGLLQEKYEVIAESKHGYLFGRRQHPAPHVEPRIGKLVFQVRIKGPLCGGISFPPIQSTPPLTLEMVLKPSGAELPLATLLSNHPGLGLHDGLSLHQESPEVYSLFVGDGTAWHRLVACRLPAEEWSLLVVVLRVDTVRVFINGSQVASRPVSNLVIKDSALPVRVGNWVGSNRPFQGMIREVRVWRAALSAADIQAEAERMLPKPSLPVRNPCEEPAGRSLPPSQKNPARRLSCPETFEN
jgi:hypothetical protein